MAYGATTQVRVTPKRDGNPSSVTIKDLETGFGSVVNVKETKIEGDSVVYTIEAVNRGSAKQTVSAKESGWTINTSSDKLSKSFYITVR